MISKDEAKEKLCSSGQIIWSFGWLAGQVWSWCDVNFPFWKPNEADNLEKDHQLGYSNISVMFRAQESESE